MSDVAAGLYQVKKLVSILKKCAQKLSDLIWLDQFLINAGG
jgi:hypothetical protein